MPTIDEKVISSLLRLIRGLQTPLVKHVESSGLTPTQFAVMEFLLHKGESTVNDVISGVFSTSGNISLVIENLIKAKLLIKRTNPNDARSRLVYLSKSGKQRISTYYPSHKDELKRLMKGVKVSEKEALIKSLNILQECIKNNTEHS